jgi:hypothetical protein
MSRSPFDIKVAAYCKIGVGMEEVIRHIAVKVTAGFADTEYYVMVPNGPAAYVSRDLVSVTEAPEAGTEVPGVIQVYVLDQGEHDALIELPGEPVVGGLRTRIDNSLLLAT